MERQKLDAQVDDGAESNPDLEASLLEELERDIETYHGNRKLTVQLAQAFFKKVEAGYPFETICDFLGISSGSFHNWMRRGKAFVDDGYEEASERIFAYFYIGCRKAFAKYRMGRIDALHSNSPFWSRDLEILSRRDRRSFAKGDIQGGGDGDFDPDERFV